MVDEVIVIGRNGSGGGGGFGRIAPVLPVGFVGPPVPIQELVGQEPIGGFVAPPVPVVVEEIVKKAKRPPPITSQAATTLRAGVSGAGILALIGGFLLAKIIDDISQQRLDDAFDSLMAGGRFRPVERPVKAVPKPAISEIVVTASPFSRGPFPFDLPPAPPLRRAPPVILPEEIDIPFEQVPIRGVPLPAAPEPQVSPPSVPAPSRPRTPSRTQPGVTPETAPKPLTTPSPAPGPQFQPVPSPVPSTVPSVTPSPTVQPSRRPATSPALRPQIQPLPSVSPSVFPSLSPALATSSLTSPRTQSVTSTEPRAAASPLPLPNCVCPPCPKKDDEAEEQEERLECWRKLVKEARFPDDDEVFNWVRIDCDTGRELKFT